MASSGCEVRRREHDRLHVKHVSAAYSVRSPPPCGEGSGVGVRPRLTARPPPRRFAPTLPTRGMVETELAACTDFTSHNRARDAGAVPGSHGLPAAVMRVVPDDRLKHV